MLQLQLSHPYSAQPIEEHVQEVEILPTFKNNFHLQPIEWNIVIGHTKEAGKYDLYSV